VEPFEVLPESANEPRGAAKPSELTASQARPAAQEAAPAAHAPALGGAAGGPCQPLSKQLLARYAKDGTVMVTVNDFSTMSWFFKHWVGAGAAADAGMLECTS
jgi:hypothetical protein